MIWWNWKTSQRLALVGTMLGVAAIPWIVIGWATKDWRALLGGTAFLFIPQAIGWLLFVPAEEMEAFNAAIIGKIEVILEFR